MPAAVYRKTPAGKEEISKRKAGLSPAERQVLIVVNGNESLTALAGLGLTDLEQHLFRLLNLGLIEQIAGAPLKAAMSALAAGVSRSSAPTAAPASASVVAPAPAPAFKIENETEIVRALQRQAGKKLVYHFGPDTATIAQKMLLAETLVEFNQSLDEIESKLAIYLGRRKAADEIAELKAKI